MAKEKWRICRQDKTYFISSWGRVFNRLTGKFLTLSVSQPKKGHVKYYKFNRHYVHRAVLETFRAKDCREGGLKIIFKDHNRLNPRLDNLDLVTPEEATRHNNSARAHPVARNY